MKDMKDFTKLDWALFGIALIVALAFNVWSLFHLATTLYAIPAYLALTASLMFDVGGLYLGRLSDKYAVNGEHNLQVKLFTNLFVLISIFLTAAHAYLLGWGIVGMIFLGAPALIVGILFHTFQAYRSRQAKRKAGTYIESLPSAGILAAVVYKKEWWAMIKAGLLNRIAAGEAKIVTPEIAPPIQVPASVGSPIKEAPKPKAVKAPKPQPAIAMTIEEPEVKVAEPIAPVEVKEEFKFGFQPTPSFTATSARGLAFEAYSQDFTDPDQVAGWINERVTKPVTKVTVQQYFSQARKLNK